MSKRLLCYDTENSVGVDENGVLDCSTLQPYYSNKVLFKTLTKDDFINVDLGTGTEQGVYSFGSKLDWLTSEDSIHVEYRMEYVDGEIIESSAADIMKIPGAPDDVVALTIDDLFVIANGINLMTGFEAVDDCVVSVINAEVNQFVNQLKIDLYKVETNKLSGDLVEGVAKLKVFDAKHENLSNFLTQETINEIEKYYKKDYLIIFKNFMIDHAYYTKNVFIHDIAFPDTREYIVFTALLGSRIVRYNSNNDKIDWWYGDGYQQKILMASESGNTTWKITVNDTGTISATKA